MNESFCLKNKDTTYRMDPVGTRTTLRIRIGHSMRSLTVDKIRKNRSDYNNNNDISFMSPTPSTSGRLHSDYVRLLFLQTHRETDRFFVVSGVLFQESDRGYFHFHRVVFSSLLKSGVGNNLVKSESSRITLNLDGTPITSKSHTHPSHSQSSRLLTSSLSLGVPVPRSTQCIYVRRVNSSDLVFSLSLHRHSFIGLLFNYPFIDS